MAIEKCAACSRETVQESNYCAYHSQALEELKRHFSSWTEAYGSSLTWKQYLDAILERKETGKWVRKVAEIENKREG